MAELRVKKFLLLLFFPESCKAAVQNGEQKQKDLEWSCTGWTRDVVPCFPLRLGPLRRTTILSWSASEKRMTELGKVIQTFFIWNTAQILVKTCLTQAQQKLGKLLYAFIHVRSHFYNLVKLCRVKLLMKSLAENFPWICSQISCNLKGTVKGVSPGRISFLCIMEGQSGLEINVWFSFPVCSKEFVVVVLYSMLFQLRSCSLPIFYYFFPSKMLYFSVHMSPLHMYLDKCHLGS